MPVEGLPFTLECMLNAALRDNKLSSFKIDGRGNQTVVVLRLTGNISTQPPVTEDSSVAYRRKCPSQVNRDRRRAEVHRTERNRASNEKKASTSSPSGLFLPTPPSLCYVTDSQEKELVADTFSLTPFVSSATPSEYDPVFNEVDINMSASNADTQTVTVDLPYNQGEEEVLCERGGESEEEEMSVTVPKSDVSDNDTKSSGAGTESGVNFHDFMLCLEDNVHQIFQKQREDIQDMIKDVTVNKKIAKEGNPANDVS